MENNKRLNLIKILLKYIVEKNRQEETFLKFLNENHELYNIEIYPTIEMPFYEIAEGLSIENEETAEEIYDFFNRKNVSTDDLIEEFCEKYDI